MLVKKQDRFHKDFAMVLHELDEAKKALKVSEIQFEQCDIDFIDIANENLNIAKRRVDLAIKKYKLLKKQQEKVS